MHREGLRWAAQCCRMKNPNARDVGRPSIEPRLELVSEGVVTIDEAALYLRTSRSSVKRLLQRGVLPYARVTTGRRIPKRALNAFLASTLVSTR